jgi:hypothetical protein
MDGYHYDKWKACKEAGIQLIQVWEDDWNRNPELMKRMLAHKLGVSLGGKIFARNTTVELVSKVVADEFLISNHIQGASDGSIRVGLKTKTGKIVAVMVLKVEPNSDGKVLNLVRFASSAQVVGGFTKLLKFIERNNPSVERVITFSDNSVSDGGLYGSNGFVVAKELAPDYSYLVGSERKHKFGYRLKRFRTDPALQFVEGFTERQLADLNGLSRVWDAGKTRWEKSFARNDGNKLK